MKLKYFFLYFILLSFGFHSFELNGQSQIDSIQYYLVKSEQTKFSDLDTKLILARRAKELSIKVGIDSLRIKSNLILADVYSRNLSKDSLLKISKENFLLTTKYKDSASFARTNYLLAWYYSDTKQADSAYYYFNNAVKVYRAIDDYYNAAKSQYSNAVIQKNEKDYTGSELASIDAFALLDKLEQTSDVISLKSFIYNNLAILFGQLEQFSESIKYHKKAIELKKTLKGDNRGIIDISKNNMAFVYKKAGDYNQAKFYFKQILENENLIHEHPRFYATVLDNYAHTEYLSGNKKKLPKLYLEALAVCDSISTTMPIYNSILIHQHLSEFYEDLGKKDSALYHAYKAKDISELYHNEDLLESLLLLSKIEEDKKARTFLNEYVKLSDSLQKSERLIRNKFARIRYETDQIEQENIQIAKERLWLLIISVVVIIASFLLYLVVTQRNKNKELQFIQKQQETNEEIYNLMLSQNETIEEARTLEKKRISEELHDGVLGRLFGTRLSLDSLNMNNSVEAIKTRSEYIDALKQIEDDIRKVSHELNTDFVSGSGFIDIIKTLVETQSIAYNISVKLEHDDSIDWNEVSNKKKIHMYRIVQESLHNIYKHAQASEVIIIFRSLKNAIELFIQDNGIGFDTTKAKSGIGLKNMNSRIKDIDGSFDINSEKDKGTTVNINVPIS